MRYRSRILSLLTTACTCSILAGFCAIAPAAEPVAVDDGLTFASDDWPWWRGPLRNGQADPNQQPPMHFSSQENVVWTAPIPGRGLSSPTVVGNQIIITSADESSGAQFVMCFDRATGAEMWSTTVHETGGMRKNNKSTLASSTAACDGQRIFVSFPNSGGLYATALDLAGKQLWQKKVSDYVVHQGYGASPALYQDLVIVAADNKGGGWLAAMNRETGDVAWRRERPQKPNYPTPTLLHIAGQDQLILVGCDQVVSYNPLTGDTLWETDGATTECVTSTLTDGKLIYTSGGYPKNHMSAIAADGSNTLVWENSERLYVPSLLIQNGYLYGVLDTGIATCWEAETGKEMWQGRLGGTFSSSPVLVGNQIFCTSETGDFFVFSANPQRFEKLAENKLGDQVLATPTICGGRIYHRVAHLDESGTRQEMLYCIGARE